MRQADLFSLIWRFRLRRFVRSAGWAQAEARRRIKRLYQREKTPNDITRYEKRLLSQNGEDGILDEIFERIGPSERVFVEFGVEDGLECNAALLARTKGWNGLFIEGDALSFQRLKANYAHIPAARVAQEFVTRDNVNDIFHRHRIPHEFDLLSIDIDGNDYWVWDALEDFRARVVVIEYNSLYPPPARWIMAYNETHRWDGTSYHGASLSSLNDLANAKGYSLIGTDARGVNAFFVLTTLVPTLGLPERTPEDCYHAPNFGFVYRHHPYRPGPSVES